MNGVRYRCKFPTCWVMGALGCYKADLIPTYIPHPLPDRWPDGEIASVKYTYFTDMKADFFGRHENGRPKSAESGVNRPIAGLKCYEGRSSKY